MNIDRVPALLIRAQTFRALKHRNYRLFLAGQVISLSGTWMQRVAQAWLVYELTRSAFALGIVGFATRVPVIFLSLFAGVLADRTDKRRILLASQTVAMAQAFVLAALTLLGVVRLWHVAVLGALLGATQSFDAPTRHSFFREMVGKRDLMNAIALNSTAFNMARLIGPALAGVLIYTIGIGGCFLVNAFSYVAVLVAYLMMRFGARDMDNSVGRHWDQLKEGLRYVEKIIVVKRAAMLIGVASLFTFSYGTLLPVFASTVLNGDARVYASALAVASLGNFKHKGLLASSGVISFPTAIIALSFMRTPAAASALCFLLGMTMILLTASMNTLVQSAIADRLRGRVMSLYVLVFLGPLPFGSLLAGRLAETFGVVATLRLGASLCLVVSSLLLIKTPEFTKFKA
jgi:MFS family permease